MKYPRDILYLLKFVGADVLIVAVGVLIMALVFAWYFLKHKRKKSSY
ncbi:MAG: hypothetical protein M1497_05055 [Nitrospirae bacterium]|nr:hypothetical protein [Nitrospirota bacterium]